MELVPLRAFADNYIWLLHDGQNAIAVDPGDSAPVAAALQDRQLKLVGILVTHHHADHTGGVAALRQETGAPVFGPAHEAIPEPYHALTGGEHVAVLGVTWRVIDVPGHTAGHIAYFASEVSGAPMLFCGDTLFSAGCGRLFEGTPAQMLASLDKLAALPPDTRVCCAHEYTMANLRFAAAVDPDNEALAAYTRHCARLRAQDLPTLPSTIAMERAINPFLRSRDPAVKHKVQQQDPSAQDAAAVFGALRAWKNRFQ